MQLKAVAYILQAICSLSVGITNFLAVYRACKSEVRGATKKNSHCVL